MILKVNFVIPNQGFPRTPIKSGNVVSVTVLIKAIKHKRVLPKFDNFSAQKLLLIGHYHTINILMYGSMMQMFVNGIICRLFIR